MRRSLAVTFAAPTLLLIVSGVFPSSASGRPQAAAPPPPPAGASPAQAAPAPPPSEAKLMAARAARAQHPNRPAPWWARELSAKPDAWYRTDEGRRIAANILSWQDAGGGWPLMNTTREPNTGDPRQAGPWGTRGALVKATVNEMRFLARGHRATGDARYREAVLEGLGFILDAQLPTGGWPKSHPPAAGEPPLAVFNDDVIPDLMTLLLEVAEGGDFASLGDDARARARAAFDRGVDFIVKSQIVSKGELTAWAQQHDAVTYAPRPGRAFEPVAISGAESAGVLRLLMRMPDPSPEVVRAIEAGVRWYRATQIDGMEVVRLGDDVVVRPNASAPPLWARFYDIETGRPIFAGRDGIVRDRLADIERERRTGYGWYTESGTGVFERYAAWRGERERERDRARRR